MSLLATTRLHVERINAGLVNIAADPAGVVVLTLVQADRAAHLAALEAEVARTTSTPADSAATSAAAQPGQTVSISDDPAEIIATVLGDCVTAQTQFRDGVQSTSRYRAALFGSISACLATHRLVLQPS